MAPDTESAQMNNVAIAVAFSGANRPKLTKMTAIQHTSIPRNGMGIDPLRCAANSQRVPPRSMAILSAWACIARWVSFSGASAWSV